MGWNCDSDGSSTLVFDEKVQSQVTYQYWSYLKSNVDLPSYLPAKFGDKGAVSSTLIYGTNYFSTIRLPCNNWTGMPAPTNRKLDFYHPHGYSIECFIKICINSLYGTNWMHAPWGFGLWTGYPGTCRPVFYTDSISYPNVAAGCFETQETNEPLIRIGDISGSGYIYNFNTWHHVKLCYSGYNFGNTLRFFINGQFIGKNTPSNNIINGMTHRSPSGTSSVYGAYAFDVLGFGGLNPFLGAIDELRIVRGIHDNDSDSNFVVPTIPFET